MDLGRDDGIAMVIAMMAMLLLTALGGALVLATGEEAIIAENFRGVAESFYAADGVLERALGDLATDPDWNLVLDGTVQSSFIDGPPGGVRTLLDGSPIDLGQILNMANCGKAACSGGDLVAVTSERPWGANNPRWQLYAYGPLSGLLPAGTTGSALYGVVMVGDDPSETDANPLRDGMGPSNPGAGILEVRAEAFGLRGAHSFVETTIARLIGPGAASGRLRVLSWRHRPLP